MPDDDWPASLDSLPVWKDHEVRDGRRRFAWEYRDLGDEWFEIEWQRQQERGEESQGPSPKFDWGVFYVLAFLGAVTMGIATFLTMLIFAGLSVTIEGTTTTVPTSTTFWIGVWIGGALLMAAIAAVQSFKIGRRFA